MQNKVIFASSENGKMQLLLSKGLFVTMTVCQRSKDILSVTFNRQLVNKLGLEQICGGNNTFLPANFKIKPLKCI